MTPQLLVLSGLADVRERYLRTIAGLDEASVAADAGTRTVLLAYRQQIQTFFIEQQQITSELLEGIRAGFGDDPSAWQPEDLTDLSEATIVSFDLLAGQHLDLTMHLPGVSRTREDLLYMLMRSVDFSLLSREHTRLLSVQESANLVWEASRFSEVTVHQPAAAIAVPWLETHTPLRWPLAIHEVGHYFLPGGDAELVSPHVERLAAERNWGDRDRASFREVLADAVAQRAVGDAYAYALAREGYLLSYESHSGSGASVHRRLELLGGPSALIDNLPESWDLDRLAPRGEDAPEPTSRDDLQRMREEAVELVGENPGNDQAAVARARQLIRGNEPPAAVLSHRADERSTLEHLAALVDATSVNERTSMLSASEVAELTRLVVHRSLTDGEILEAAWLEDCDRDAPTLIERLSTVPVIDAIDAESREVAERDTWLSRALQAAAVHRWLETSAELVDHP